MQRCGTTTTRPAILLRWVYGSQPKTRVGHKGGVSIQKQIKLYSEFSLKNTDTKKSSNKCNPPWRQLRLVVPPNLQKIILLYFLHYVNSGNPTPPCDDQIIYLIIKAQGPFNFATVCCVAFTPVSRIRPGAQEKREISHRGPLLPASRRGPLRVPAGLTGTRRRHPTRSGGQILWNTPPATHPVTQKVLHQKGKSVFRDHQKKHSAPPQWAQWIQEHIRGKRVGAIAIVIL